VTPEFAVEIGRKLFENAAIMLVPILGLAMVVGIVVGVLQTATQLQEATLTFVPKLLSIAVAMLIAGPWMMQRFQLFVREIFAIMVQVK
jgi:flagellar biosynthetic protein FliQ